MQILLVTHYFDSRCAQNETFLYACLSRLKGLLRLVAKAALGMVHCESLLCLSETFLWLSLSPLVLFSLHFI